MPSLESNPLHAPYYADGAFVRTVEVVENVRLARDTFRVRFACPEIARAIVPGQFLMLRAAGLNDPLLGRPLALYEVYRDASGEAAGVDIVYLVMGKFTRWLSQARAGARLEVWGPLGNGFPSLATKHLILVAGGIGQTPMLALAREYLRQAKYGKGASGERTASRAERVTFCYGARSAEYLAGLEDFAAIAQRGGAFDMKLSTDDGSRGHRGFVTDLLRETLAAHGESAATDCHVMCCGPEPMLEAVAQLCGERGAPCHVSLETPMACGIGICFSCVARVRDESGAWDYKRTCVEGPVFEAACIEW